MLDAKCPLHVHQQVPHRDVLSLVQRAGPFTRVPTETGKDVGMHTSSRKASTSKRQSVYVTSTPGSVDLKISISNLMGASRFLSLLPVQPLRLCWQPTVSLTVEYPSESGTPLSGEEGGKPPPPTVVHWVFGGLPHSHAVPVWAVSHHASIRGKRLMLKWAEGEIHSKKASSTWVRTASVASCSKP